MLWWSGLRFKQRFRRSRPAVRFKEGSGGSLQRVGFTRGVVGGGSPELLLCIFPCWSLKGLPKSRWSLRSLVGIPKSPVQTNEFAQGHFVHYRRLFLVVPTSEGWPRPEGCARMAAEDSGLFRSSGFRCMVGLFHGLRFINMQRNHRGPF